MSLFEIEFIFVVVSDMYIFSVIHKNGLKMVLLSSLVWRILGFLHYLETRGKEKSVEGG